jgi:hypothetical protein
MFIRPNQELNNLYYFTAVPTDPENSPSKQLYID